MRSEFLMAMSAIALALSLALTLFDLKPMNMPLFAVVFALWAIRYTIIENKATS